MLEEQHGSKKQKGQGNRKDNNRRYKEETDNDDQSDNGAQDALPEEARHRKLQSINM